MKHLTRIFCVFMLVIPHSFLGMEVALALAGAAAGGAAQAGGAAFGTALVERYQGQFFEGAERGVAGASSYVRGILPCSVVSAPVAVSSVSFAIAEEPLPIVSQLRRLAAHRDYEQIAQLQQQGYSIDASDETGQTLFMRACAEGQLAAANFFMNHGADINAIDALGESAVAKALRNKRKEVFLFLLQMNADTFVKTATGDPLIALAWNEQTQDALLAHAKKKPDSAEYRLYCSYLKWLSENR